jgi:hypothetical protein
VVYVVPGTSGGSPVVFCVPTLPAGPAGATGPAGPTVATTLISSPSTSDVNGGAGAGEGGRYTALVYPGLGQGNLSGFWQPPPGTGNLIEVATEANAGKQVSYFAGGFLDDSTGAAEQRITFFGTVPSLFTTFSGDLTVLTKYVSQTGASGNVMTLRVDLLNPTTGAILASATRVLADGVFDAAYVAMTIARAALNAAGFVAGDLFALRLSVVPDVAGPSETKVVRFSKVTIPFA